MKYVNVGLLILVAAASFSAVAAPKKPFKTSDFKGEWVMTSSSVGGIGINQGTGVASTVLRHMTLNADGVGTDDNASYTFYKPDGTLIRHDDSGGDTITLTVEDPLNGAGKLTYVDTNTYKTTQVYDFIALRSKNGAVNKLFLQLTNSSGAKVVVSGVAERQQEK